MNMVILPCVEARSGFRGLDRATRRLFLRSYSPAEEFGVEVVTVTSSRRSEKMSGCFKRWCGKEKKGGLRRTMGGPRRKVAAAEVGGRAGFLGAVGHTEGAQFGVGLA